MQHLYIGIMSGTSLDGIDTVIADFNAKVPQVVAHIYNPFPETIKAKLLSLISDKQSGLETLGRLHTELGRLYAAQVEAILIKAQLRAKNIQAIGLHGQTIFHAPEGPYPFTWQIGNAHEVAVITKIPVIADFRGLDIALQGQGAPLAPLAHLAIFGQAYPCFGVVNLGGIANITMIAHQKILKAFDIGPANCLIDAWMQTNQKQAFDKEGAFARSGLVIPELLKVLSTEPYFSAPAPKSTGRELFNLAWVRPHLHKDYRAADIAATLTELTARSIVDSLLQNDFTPETLILCGGGAENLYLVERLKSLAPCTIISSSDFGYKPEHIEPVAFAYLAKAFLEQQLFDLKNITGATQQHQCGVLYPPR